jgi:hypothetical protein
MRQIAISGPEEPRDPEWLPLACAEAVLWFMDLIEFIENTGAKCGERAETMTITLNKAEEQIEHWREVRRRCG